jgi:hypothetical protein
MPPLIEQRAWLEVARREVERSTCKDKTWLDASSCDVGHSHGWVQAWLETFSVESKWRGHHISLSALKLHGLRKGRLPPSTSTQSLRASPGRRSGHHPVDHDACRCRKTRVAALAPNSSAAIGWHNSEQIAATRPTADYGTALQHQPPSASSPPMQNTTSNAP